MRILVGMSGGVDSSYTAIKLKQAGHDVEGAVVLMHEYSDLEGAESAARKIGIKLNVIDAREEFEKIVKTNFVDEYINARTPNPCIVCNPKVKFRALADYAIANGFDRIATGHYAKVTEYKVGGESVPAIARSLDTGKDQSYMLYRLPPDIISILMLPLGEMTKDEVKADMAALGLCELIKKDSQEICFLPDGDYPAYIESVRGSFPIGDFLDTDGTYLGKHNGIIRYTVGQRKGLGVSFSSRLFIRSIDPASNTIILANEPPLRDKFKLKSPLFVSDDIDFASITDLAVKVRYGARPVEGRVELLSADEVEISLENPAKSVAPGQSCVIYDGDVVIGGGFIFFD